MRSVSPSPGFVVCKKIEETTSSTLSFDFGNKKPIPSLGEVIESTIDTYQPGQTIVYKEFSAYELELDQESYLIIEAEDIIGTITE